MTKYIRSFILLVVFINAIELSAQRIFPVQIRPSIRVGSVFLADYEDPSNFMVQVRLNDLNYPILHTRLKITIQKDDKIIRSKVGIPLDLIGGQTIILSSSDLKSLFASKDLDLSNFSGSDKNVRTLPEGTYRFSFKATEVKSGQTVSDSTTDFTWATITVNDPPLLNLPGNLSEIEIRPGSQNIFFSWTPRGLPALPGTQFKYTMRMVQVNPPDRNPYEAMNTGVQAITDRIFENLDYTTFIYDQSLFNLLPGAVYAWQIEAYELINENGTMVPSSQRFRKNGFSEVYSFKVKENCPEIITEKPITDTVWPGAPLIVLRWNRDPENHKAYEVKYRPAGTVLPWTIAQTLTNELKLGGLDLEKGKQYEYTVAAKCNSWQTAVYGGMFMLPASECEAPLPVEIVSNDDKGIKLSWDKVPSADSYSIHYKYSLSNDSTVTKNISEPVFLLPPVSAGFYTVQIDARCSGKTGEGKQLKINYTDTELSTDCPLPNPVRLTAQTAALSAGKKVDVTWNSLPAHAGYELKYHHRDSTTQYSYTSTTSGLKNIPAATGQIYQYQLTYTCKSGKTVTAPPGWFRAESEEDTVVRIKPGTASCFPPAFTMAEPKSKTSARIEWEKVKGADEYQVFYAPHGSTDIKLFTTTSSDARITELTATEKYDYKIKCRCGGEFSIFSKTGLLDMGISADGTCDSAKYFKVAKVTEKEIQLTWKYEPSHTGYKIQWKELSQPWDQKYTENLSNIDDLKASKMTGDSIKYTIENLNAGTTYQFKLQVICQGKLAVINGPLSGNTKSEKEDKKDCSSPNACDRSVTKLKTTLNKGDTIQVADYKMVISDIKSTGQDKWSGEADAEAPFIGLNEHIRLKTSFTDIVVNEKSCALGGKISIDSTTFQALADSTRNKIKNFVAEVDKYTDIAKSGLAALDSANKYGNTALNYYQGGGDQGKVKTGKLNPQITSDKSLTTDKIKIGSGGEIMIDGIGTGKQAPALIKDKDGQIFSVGKDKQTILAGKYDPTYLKLDSLDLNRKDYPVDFVANSKAKYAFDKFRKTYGERPAMSPHYLKRGDTYFSAKAIVPSEIDYVDFKIVAGDLNRSDLTFVNREGFVFAKDDNNTIIVVGGPSSDAQEVFAVTDKNGKREIVGVLLLASYEPIVKKVVIIPVQLKDGLQKKISKITEQLNNVYGKVGITYTIEEDTSFRKNSDWCETPNCKFTPTGSALLSNNYTGDEKNVRDAYISFKGPDNLDKDAAYIFAIGSPNANTGDEELQGKMRFEEQFGFLYNVSRMNEESLGKILAHELGHGNYLLYHTFEKMYLGDGSKNTTFNVMDYGMKGDSLNKMQWDIVHQPGVNWGVFNRDGDQEILKDQDLDNIWIGNFLSDVKMANNFENYCRTYNLCDDYLKSSNSDINSLERLDKSKFGTILTAKNIVINNQTIDKIYVKIPPKNVILKPEFEYTMHPMYDDDSYGIKFHQYIKVKSTNSNNFILITSTSYANLNIIREYLQQELIENKNLLLFVNGYRNTDPASWGDGALPPEFSNSNNEICYKIDAYDDYWEGIDKLLIKRIETNNVVYADGHHSITTSNHNVNDDQKTSREIFALNMKDYIESFKVDGTKQCKHMEYRGVNSISLTSIAFNETKILELHTKPNEKGFNLRRNSGYVCGLKLIEKLSNHQIPFFNAQGVNNGKIDIVAHSMGFAYALGMIEALKDNNYTKQLGRFYIIAPENAISGKSLNIFDFEQVFQYGSNENKDYTCEQDGVAPQTPVKGLSNEGSLKNANYGRVYFPNTLVNKLKGKYVEVHSIKNYGWILDVDAETTGYVKKRNK